MNDYYGGIILLPMMKYVRRREERETMAYLVMFVR